LLCVNNVSADVLHKLMKWNEESLKCHLPLQPDTSVDMSVSVFGMADFMSSDHLPQFSCMLFFVSVSFLFCCSVSWLQRDGAL